MNALVYHGPKKMLWEHVPDPKIEDQQLLVEPRAIGICGSDLHGYLGITGRRIPPMIMGHEFSGVVTEVGKQVRKFSEGDRVCIQPIQFCSTCEFCRAGYQNICPNKQILGVLDVNGAMAELAAVNENNTFHLGSDVSFIDASLVEPFSVARAATDLAPEINGKDVAIVGMGTIGLCLLQLVRMADPHRIFVTDLSELRLEAARKLGAEVLLNPQKIDVVATVKEKTSGRVVTTELNIQGVYGFTTEIFKNTLELMNSGRLRSEEIVSIRAELPEGASIFNILVEGKDKYIKAILTNKSDDSNGETS